MPELTFPELPEPQWIRYLVDGLEWREAVRFLCARYGCGEHAAGDALRNAGLASKLPWSGRELQALREFYPRWAAAYVAQAIGRSLGSTFSQAHKQGLHKERSERLGTEKAKAKEREFWREWQGWLQSNMAEWVRQGIWHDCVGFRVWPAQLQEVCNVTCKHWAACLRNGTGPLPCEAVTLGECLEFRVLV